jgi:hypothetical protein
MLKRGTWFFAILFAYALFCRVLPYAMYNLLGMSIDPSTTWYPWNFSPLMAFSLFAGACYIDHKWAFLMPLGVLFISDLGILALSGDPDFVFRRGQPLIYLCFAAATAAGLLLRSRPNLLTAVPTGAAAEGLFFIVTNFGVWLFGNGETYPMTLQGLGLCYVAALPFFGRSLISTSLYVTVLFSPAGLRAAGVTRSEGTSEETARARI